MSIDERIQRINERDEQRRIETNALIDRFHMAYKIEDSEENVFVWAGLSSGFPVYRGIGGQTHIFDLTGMKVLQQHDVD